ncbi:uncharacterized protein LOC143918801 [Arctopsyche grandis]|uniref:uncharacterized protein LOC143918801 n=1 Tax=Arctopsyche grandis TaxID=121162 RepID=UPI00406D7269
MAALDGASAPPSSAPPSPSPAQELPVAPQLEILNSLPAAERASALVTRWRDATAPPVSSQLLHNLYRYTLHFILQNGWSRLEESSRDGLIEAVQKCGDSIQRAGCPPSAEELRVRYLVLVARDPWHHPVLKDIMDGIQPDTQKVHSWIREEGGSGATERLIQLCAAGGKLEGAALRLAFALAPLPPTTPILPSTLHSFASEALLVLLLRARKTTECISHIKALEVDDAIAIISRLATRKKSFGRIWRHAHDTALLCGQVLVATCLVKPMENNQLGTLAAQLASLYAQCPEELAPAFRKLLHSADTAAHIYIVCRAVQHQFQDSMRPFVYELYIRALTTGVNELERQKIQDESDETATSSASHTLAAWFLSLADLVAANPIVSAECVLTAFSLHPSKHYYQKVLECSSHIHNWLKKGNKAIEDSSLFKTVESMQSDVSRMDLHDDTKADEESTQSLISAAVLEGEGLELSVDLCRDLAVLLSGPRLKYLTWDLSWDKLSQHCVSYMADTEEGTKTVTTELKYVHLDYSQFEIKEPEIYDIYYGIEKGYEHHLEIEDDWDEDEYVGDSRNSINNASADGSLHYKNSCDQTKDPKKVKKKSSKKSVPPEDGHKVADRSKVSKNKSNVKQAFVTSSTESCNESDLDYQGNRYIGTDKSYVVRPVQKNNNSILQMHLKPAISRTYSANHQTPSPQSSYYFDPLTKKYISKSTLNTNKSSHIVSVYRKQMELHEAHKRELEKAMFGSCNAVKISCEEDKLQRNDLNFSYPQPNHHTAHSSNNATYHEGLKENFKNYCDKVKTELVYSQNLHSPVSAESNSNSGHHSTASNTSPNHCKSNVSKSSLLTFRKYNAKHTMPSTSVSYYDASHTVEPASANQSDQVVDWENLLNSEASSINRLPTTTKTYQSNTSKCSTSHHTYLGVPKNPVIHTSSNDVIKSLNLTSTKLPTHSSCTQSNDKVTTLNELKLLQNRLKILQRSGECGKPQRPNTSVDHSVQPVAMSSQSHCSVKPTETYLHNERLPYKEDDDPARLVRKYINNSRKNPSSSGAEFAKVPTSRRYNAVVKNDINPQFKDVYEFVCDKMEPAADVHRKQIEKLHYFATDNQQQQKYTSNVYVKRQPTCETKAAAAYRPNIIRNTSTETTNSKAWTKSVPSVQIQHTYQNYDMTNDNSHPTNAVPKRVPSEAWSGDYDIERCFAPLPLDGIGTGSNYTNYETKVKVEKSSMANTKVDAPISYANKCQSHYFAKSNATKLEDKSQPRYTENADVETVYKKFVAELESSVNAGIFNIHTNEIASSQKSSQLNSFNCIGQTYRTTSSSCFQEPTKTPISTTSVKSNFTSPNSIVGPVCVPIENHFESKQSPSKTKVQPEQSPIKTKLQPEKSPSKTKVQPEQSLSKTKVQPEKSPSTTKVQPVQPPRQNKPKFPAVDPLIKSKLHAPLPTINYDTLRSLLIKKNPHMGNMTQTKLDSSNECVTMQPPQTLPPKSNVSVSKFTTSILKVQNFDNVEAYLVPMKTLNKTITSAELKTDVERLRHDNQRSHKTIKAIISKMSGRNDLVIKIASNSFPPNTQLKSNASAPVPKTKSNLSSVNTKDEAKASTTSAFNVPVPKLDSLPSAQSNAPTEQISICMLNLLEGPQLKTDRVESVPTLDTLDSETVSTARVQTEMEVENVVSSIPIPLPFKDWTECKDEILTHSTECKEADSSLDSLYDPGIIIGNAKCESEDPGDCSLRDIVVLPFAEILDEEKCVPMYDAQSKSLEIEDNSVCSILPPIPLPLADLSVHLSFDDAMQTDVKEKTDDDNVMSDVLEPMQIDGEISTEDLRDISEMIVNSEIDVSSVVDDPKVSESIDSNSSPVITGEESVQTVHKKIIKETKSEICNQIKENILADFHVEETETSFISEQVKTNVSEETETSFISEQVKTNVSEEMETSFISEQVKTNVSEETETSFISEQVKTNVSEEMETSFISEQVKTNVSDDKVEKPPTDQVEPNQTPEIVESETKSDTIITEDFITLDDSDDGATAKDENKAVNSTEVIEILSDGDEDDTLNNSGSNSDVELVMTNDPIAVDVKPTVFPQVNAQSHSSIPPTPVFFTMASDSLTAKNTKRRKLTKRSNWMRNRRKLSQKPSDSLLFLNNDVSSIIKIGKIPPSDREKLQKPCEVRIKRDDLLMLKKKLQQKVPQKRTSASTKKFCRLKKFLKDGESLVLSLDTKTLRSRSKTVSQGMKPTTSKAKSLDTCHKDSLYYESTKPLRTVDSLKTLCQNVLSRAQIKLEVDSDPSSDDAAEADSTNTEQNSKDVTKNEDKEFNRSYLDFINNKTSDFQTDIEDDISSNKSDYKPDVLNNYNLIDFEHELDISNRIGVVDEESPAGIKKSVQPDILHQPRINHARSRRSPCKMVDSAQERAPVEELQFSMSSCPDLISKTNDSKSYVTMQQPDIILSNNDCKKTASFDNTSNADNSGDHSFNLSFSLGSLRTYQKHSYHKNKRKMESNNTGTVKKFRNNPQIDLPRVSQKEVGKTTHKLNIDKQQSYDRAFNLSIKELFLRGFDDNDDDDDDDEENDLGDGPIRGDLGVDLSEFDFLSNDSGTDDCSRSSFYSPIFNEGEVDKCESIKRYIEKCEKHETLAETLSRNVESEKHQRQGMGFGVKSGSGNLKGSLRGRPEGPAAVLSDAFTARPPLALHNFSANRRSTDHKNEHSVGVLNSDKELNNNSLHKIMKNSKAILKNFSNENMYAYDKPSVDISKCLHNKEKRSEKLSNPKSDFKNIFSRVPGLEDLDFMRPSPYNAIVQVVQLGQSPVTSTQQNPLSALPTASQTTTNEYADISANNSVEYRSPSHDDSHQSSSNENTLPDLKEDDNGEKREDSAESNSDRVDGNSSSLNISEGEMVHLNQIQMSSNSDPTNSMGNLGQITLDKPSLDFSDQVTSQANFVENIHIEEKDATAEDSPSESQMPLNVPCSTANFITNRGQTLVNLLSQKIIHSPVGGQHVQMTTFPKGTINALSLQQALAQILPPPLSQASGDGVIQTASHSTGPQVVHIVQGKSGSQNSNSFGGLLVDNGQSSVINASGTTQVLHIVQGKSTPNTSNASILSQSQFSGLSLVDSGSQQSGNQVLHIVNAGMQNKNNTAQVLKRVNLLTSITNPHGNNEQKMVQFVCKSSDGKSIQLNAQHQRGMVLRLQPIDNSNFTPSKSSEIQTTTHTHVTTVQSGIKPQNDQAQELKSRSVYEENYAKFIQNSSQIMPSSPEKSITLPKFNQAFGKSVFQDNTTVQKSNNDNIEQAQNPSVSASCDQQQSTQDLSMSTSLSLSQLGHISNPPLLIRKNAQSNIVHQNVMQQVKQSMAPMNIQTIHGGVIYTRQIPVNTINLITVPSSDMIDEVQLQNIQKQNQEKANSTEQLESQVVKIVSQDQQANSSVMMDTGSDDTNQSFAEQTQSHVNTHPLLTQMRIKMPMLSKGGGQMVTGARVVRPVLQIQRNLIPGTNPAVYQQLVLTTAPALRQPVPTPVTTIRPSRPASTAPHQESNLSSSTLEQLREFDMVLEQVKERSTVQPGSNSNSTFSDTSPQRQVIESADIDTQSQSSVVHAPAPREVLYSIGPNQTVNVTYVNQKVISKSPAVLTTTYSTTDSIITNISSQNSPSSQITHGLVNTITHSKPCSNTPTKVNSKSIKTKPSKPTNPSSSTATKPSNPVPTKTSLQKPLEDEQTTQRILYILAEYKEQVENSPDKDKPAPRRRSNPPTNPTTSSKRKKGSGGSSKKGSGGQSLQEMSPLGGEDAGHTMGSEDSSCGLSQGECTDNSIQGPDNPSPQASPQKAAKKLLFQPDSDLSSAPQLQQQQPQQQQRNVIIADGQTIAMARPNSGKTTAVLMPANYLLPMSMVKGGQQITIVTNQGPKILNVPHGDGNTTNTLFLQRLISPAGLKPMLTRPGQVRHVRLPANTVQNLHTFNLSPSTNINPQDTSWITNSSLNNAQPKLVVEYNHNLAANSDLNPDSVKSEISDSQSLKDETMSLSGEHISSVKLEDSIDASSENRCDDNISMDQNQIQDSNMSEHVLQQVHVTKPSGNATLNLIQVHSLNSPDCGKLFSVQNSSGLNSLIQLSKSSLNQTLHSLNADSDTVVQESLLRKQVHLDSQFLRLNKESDSEVDMKLSDINQLEDNLSMTDDLPNNVQQNFVLSHGSQQNDDSIGKCHGSSDSHTPWSTNGGVNRDNSSPFGYENSPHRLSNHDDHHDVDEQETEEGRDLSDSVATRVLRHSYSPSSSPTGPRHLYHKMFISTPVKKSFGSEVIEHSVSSVDDDKQYVQVLDIRHPDGKSCGSESVDVTGTVQGGRNIAQSSSSIHSAASLRHKYAVMEHELRLQKSLSEECEDLGVDSPSASDLFPEAELLFAASPSSQFDQSQDGCILPTANHASPSTTHISTVGNHQIATSSSLPSNLTRDSRMLNDQPMDVGEESEFARMHPNTTFHSGEIELVSDDADDASVNISFRTASSKQSIPSSHVASKRNEIVRSVIEGIGSSGGITTFSQSKMASQFSLVDLSRRSRNALSSLQSSDDYSEGADDSMNSAESKEGILANNKSLDGILTNEIVKRDLNLSSTESSVCMSSSIIQRNVAQVIRHASSDQLGNDPSEKLCNANVNELAQNGRSFLSENSNDARTTAESGILKSLMLERDGRDTCSSPEQHSELFWESNSNSNQSEERIPQAPQNLLDFSSEDSNKCCKSPLSCEENTNSTDSSSLGGHDPQVHNSHHPLRVNSVIKTSGISSAADGPILHSALISNTSNVNNAAEASNKLQPTPLANSIHKNSDSNTSSSPEESDAANRTGSRRSWGRSLKGSGGRRAMSPRSLSAEINMGAEIETSSSEGVSILTKSTSGTTVMHSGSSTPEEGSANNRRVSLRGSGGIKRSCHCCGGPPPTSASASASNSGSTSRRPRRRPPPLH